MSVAQPNNSAIRSLQPGETGPLLEVFAGLSARSRLSRFHTPVPRLGPSMVTHLTAHEKGWHEAFLASVDGRPAGIGRWIRYAAKPHRADVALEVVDSHQRRGVGRTLLAAVAESAAEAGVAFLLFTVRRDNTPVRRSLARAGAVVEPHEPEQLWIPTAVLLGYLTATGSCALRAG